MTADVIFLPRDLTPQDVAGRTVVVFDVFRFTTTLTTAFAAGAAAVWPFGNLDAARKAWAAFNGPKLLCGELGAVRPEGFDLGNSPGEYTPDRVAGITLFFSTTNGTVAVLAAESASATAPSATPPGPLFAGALVNVSAVAGAVLAAGKDLTLLCSGTEGRFSAEDVIGAGAVLAALQTKTSLDLRSDRAIIALAAFQSVRDDLPACLRQTHGGHNIRRNKLDPDIALAARLDVFDVVPRLERLPELHFVQ
jgi:2-phosphosulfolactate phosphatase